MRLRYKSAIKPWRHQKKALKRLWRMGSALVWGDVGTGKTKIVVDYVLARHKARQINRVLIVCPLAAVGVWEQEFHNHSDELNICTQNQMNSLSDITAVVARMQVESKQLKIIILTFNALTNYAKLLAHTYRPDVLIYDESQYLRNYSATRTRRALYLSRYARWVVGLSGTPCPNGYHELYYQMKCIKPGALPLTKAEFVSRYCVMGGYMGREIVGYRNVKELAKRLSTAVIRIPKSVLKLPPTIDQVVPVVLTGKAKSTYRKLEKESVYQLTSGEVVPVDHQLTQLQRLLQITGGFLEDVELNQDKLKLLFELLESEPGKAVIFAHYRNEISAIVKELKKRRISHTFITGETSGRERKRRVQDFQTKKDPKVFVVQTRAGGIAITLTAASVAFFYSLTWDAEAYVQARGRIHRGGQEQTCRYVHLVAQGTIDEDVLQAVKGKENRQEFLARVVRRFSGG